MTKKWVLGFDIGGTSVKYARVFEDGACEEMGRAPVLEEHKTQEGMLALLLQIVASEVAAKGDAGFAGIGIGVAGVIDQPEGLMRQSPNFPLWQDFPIKEELQKALPGKSIAIENDVNAIALGEHWTGAAAGEKNFILMAIGTGLGGAVFLNGALWTGMHGMAGEIGHTNVVPFNGRPCNCGAEGCLEAYVSQVGLKHTIEKHQNEEFRHVFRRLPPSQWPEKLSELADEGNENAEKIFRQWGLYLGITIGSLLNVLDIERVLIGGGIGKALPLFRKSLMANLQQHCFKAIARRARVSACTLGDKAGIIGSAALAFAQSGVALAPGPQTAGITEAGIA